MRKFKITTSKEISRQGSVTYNKQPYSIEIECDKYKENRKEIEITSDNIDSAKELNENYKLGDIHKCPIESISFFQNGVIKNEIDVWGDCYYKLEEFINGEYIMIDKHRCSNL